MKRIVIFILAGLLFVLSLFLLIKSLQPIEIISSEHPLPQTVQTAGGETYRLPLYSLDVSSPSMLKLGITSHLNANLIALDSPEPTDLPSLTDGYIVSLETRVDLINGIVEPAGTVRDVIQANRSQSMTWNISTDQKAVVSGTIWMYLLLDPRSTPGKTAEIALFAIPLEFPVISVLGMNIDVAIFVSIVGFLFCIGLSIFLFLSRTRKRIPKRR